LTVKEIELMDIVEQIHKNIQVFEIEV